MSHDDVSEFLWSAVQELRAQDAHLLEVCANERSITHRLAIYMEALLPQRSDEDWQVDCEYNRNHDDPKEIPSIELALGDDVPTLTDLEAKTVYPDIIVHRRRSDDNLLVVEVKKSDSPVSPDYDRNKLLGYLAGLGYSWAAFVEIPVGSNHLEAEPTIVVSGEDRVMPAF